VRTRLAVWWAGPIGLLSILGLYVGVSCENVAPDAGPPKPPDRVSAEPAPIAAARGTESQGLTDLERQRFFHLAEGSEFVPYCALKLLAKEQGRTLDAHFARYHLIPDAKSDTNPLGLPIGLTVSQDPFRLVGFNCAACHVAKIPTNPPQLVIGGPGSFDIRQFYDDLIPWLTELRSDNKRLRKVAWCMLLGSKDRAGASSGDDQTSEKEVSRELLDELEQGTTDDRTHAQLYDGVDEAASDPTSSGAHPALERATTGAVAVSNRFKALPGEKRKRVLESFVEGFKRAKGLLVARLQSLDIVGAVGKVEPTTLPGPGRVDAFMTAINLLNAPRATLSMDSPVAFPHLWGVAQLKWVHWDNNTNATLQRNLGQAIGVGALLATDPGHPTKVLGTTLKIPEILELESLIRKITPPLSPLASAGSTLVSAGEATYKQQCARCHEPKSDGSMPDLLPGDHVQTDDRRLKNFERSFEGQPLLELLAGQLAEVERSAKADSQEKKVAWRLTGKYGARTLRGVWATAPYLHNGSVPTLRDLLTAPEQRPKKFVLDHSRYDAERVGFALLPQATDVSPEFDTSKSGNGNGGHPYGTDLEEGKKQALLVYLKQL
jgi:hypothetical protein